jgi:hypothetical protein
MIAFLSEINPNDLLLCIAVIATNVFTYRLFFDDSNNQIINYKKQIEDLVKENKEFKEKLMVYEDEESVWEDIDDDDDEKTCSECKCIVISTEYINIVEGKKYCGACNPDPNEEDEEDEEDEEEDEEDDEDDEDEEDEEDEEEDEDADDEADEEEEVSDKEDDEDEEEEKKEDVFNENEMFTEAGLFNDQITSIFKFLHIKLIDFEPKIGIIDNYEEE